MNKRPLYSPTQITLGSFWGGPLAAVFFLRENFITLGQLTKAKQTLRWGGVLVGLLLAILPFIPDKFPNMAIPVAYCVAARELAKKYQITKEALLASEQYTFQSNWRIFGLGFVLLLAFLVLAVGVMFALEAVGVEIEA